MKKNRIKNNLIYYWSVVARITTGLVCTLSIFAKRENCPAKGRNIAGKKYAKSLRKLLKS
ncbi:hypothetical protein CRH03_25635 [Clostridium sp. HMb25]|nr:hypothetical protein CRH03_25635 [Clostridium sp. HMb25]